MAEEPGETPAKEAETSADFGNSSSSSSEDETQEPDTVEATRNKKSAEDKQAGPSCDKGQPGEEAGPVTASSSREAHSATRPWDPDRVKRALEKSKNFDEFRQNRPFRYLHLFSGERDQLSISLKKAAEKARLEIYVDSLDRKKDKEINLAAPATYDEIDKSVEEGDWDGYHSGFPCGSFSRVQWRDTDHGPGPVRSAAHIYGLPGNTVRQQREADERTLMATRAAWLHRKQTDSFRRRALPETSTMENPPGAVNTGSAWDLPELKQVLDETNSSVAEFNTCAYQSQQKRRWYKPAKWAGNLESLATLAKVCRCPEWVTHVPLIGKSATEAAGAYPEALADAVAAKEWLRYQMSVKSSEVNELQMKWLDNEDERRKHIYEETKPIIADSITQEKKRKVPSKANAEEELVTASSSVGPTKKRTREEQNDFAIGSMRNPAMSVARLHQVKKVGEQIDQAWRSFVTDFPQTIDLARDYGSREAKFDDKVLRNWTARLEGLLEVNEQEGITLKDNTEFRSPLNSFLWDAWRMKARDPEQYLGQWAREGVPLGMDQPIPDSTIFPPVEPDEVLEERTDMRVLSNLKNYESVETQKQEAAIEIDRYVKKGFCKVVALEEMHKKYPTGTASRLVLIVKQKPDGSTKRRIVIDMRRSQGNDRATVTERIVLPRPQDVVNQLRVMRKRETELPGVESQRSALKTSSRFANSEVEFVLIDLQDALCHFGLHPTELKHAVSPGLENWTGIVWCAMLFGFKRAPLIMGRLSAAIGRLLQSTFHPASGQVQIYIGDVLLTIRGPEEERNLQVSKVLYLLAAFGVQVATHKGERGRRVQWIGTTMELTSHHILIGTPPKMIEEIKTTMANWDDKRMVPIKEPRSFAGRLSWVAGIVPRLRWTVTSVYAVLTAAIEEEATEKQRAQKRQGDRRPKMGLVAVKRLGTVIPWLKAVFEVSDIMFIRKEKLIEQEAAHQQSGSKWQANGSQSRHTKHFCKSIMQKRWTLNMEKHQDKRCLKAWPF